MAEAGDIRAGGAYVELGTKNDKLSQGLAQADAAVKEWSNKAAGAISSAAAAGRAFADGMKDVGTKLMAMGGMMGAPLLVAAKEAADFGEKIGKLASQTGMSAEALSGLKYQAESMGISIDAVGAGVKGMQKALFDGGKETAEAFKAIGLSVNDLKGMSPEQQIAKIADGLQGIDNPGQRAALAMQVLGRSGSQLLPLFEGGSAEIARAGREAQKLGLILTGDQARKLGALDNSFDRMSGAVKGAGNAIGTALAPGLTKIVDKITDCVIAFSKFVDQNPGVIEEWGKLAVEVAAAGAALFAVGATISALMSPVFLATVAIAGIGMAVLAVTDVLGVTDTGFGELFNSIRVGGTGLGTWLGAFFLWIEKAWNHVSTGMSITWDIAATGIRAVLSMMISSFSTGIGYILQGFGFLAKSVDVILNGIVSAYNKVAEALGRTPIQAKFNMGETLQGAGELAKGFGSGMVQQTEADVLDLPNRIDKRLYSKEKANATLEKEIQALFQKDPQDGTTGISIDTERGKKAIQNIIDKAWALLSGVAGGAISAAGFTTNSWESSGGKKKIGTDTAPAGTVKEAFSATGTFSGYAGGGLAASGVFNQQLHESKQANTHLAKIAKNTESGAVAAFAG
jgi:hypothetical protein